MATSPPPPVQEDVVATPRPRRGRRGVAILFVLAMGVAGWWWSQRGAIDPRLVGRWENIERSGLPGDMRFADDGNASYVAAYISLPVYSHARWCVQNDELVFTHPTTFDRRLSWRAVRRNFDSLYGWVVNGGPGMVRMRIRELTDTTLALELGEAWGPPNDKVARFRRIAK